MNDDDKNKKKKKKKNNEVRHSKDVETHTREHQEEEAGSPALTLSDEDEPTEHNTTNLEEEEEEENQSSSTLTGDSDHHPGNNTRRKRMEERAKSRGKNHDTTDEKKMDSSSSFEQDNKRKDTKNNFNSSSNRRSPSAISRMESRPDPPPSVAGEETAYQELDNFEDESAAAALDDNNNTDHKVPVSVVDATPYSSWEPPPSVTSGLTPAGETTQHASHPPDPPPSVIDFEEDDDRGLDDDQDSLDAVMEHENSEHAITLQRDDMITEDENRLDGHILQAALAAAPLSIVHQKSPQQQPPLVIQPHEGAQVHFAPSLPSPPTEPHSVVGINGGQQHFILSTEQELQTAVGLQHSFMTATPNGFGQGQQAVIVQSSSFGQQQQQHSSSQPTIMRELQSFGQQQQQHQQPQSIMVMQGTIAPPPPNGRRKIRLRMEEDPPLDSSSSYGPGGEGHRAGFLKSIRRRSQIMFGSHGATNGFLSPISENTSKPGGARNEPLKPIDRGTISVSWFEGTSTQELQEHVRKSVARKLKLPQHIHLIDVRVLDINTDEEIVLSPFIPNESEFLLRFGTRDISKNDADTKVLGPPDSPSAAPSPHPELMGGLSPDQLAHLTKKLDALRSPVQEQTTTTENKGAFPANTPSPRQKKNRQQQQQQQHDKENDKATDEDSSDDDEMLLHSEDPIEARLRQITELLLLDREQAANKRNQEPPRHDKRQVIFVLANYFVLFLSLIAISAEIQARAPGWIEALETELKSVQNCAADQDALFECVSRGDFAGLIASILLWLSRSVATRRVFLFGFESPKKLWNVVYECLVTSFCWGFSYMFIRRGMNPDTRERFLQKYWKDAVYGSLAGFNAAFMKQVLKNLIPQEAVEDALRERQLKILSWLPKFSDS